MDGLSGGEVENISFTARAGEIVGLAGLEGSGVPDIARDAVRHASARRPAPSSILTEEGLPKNPTEAARRGVCFVPADRRRLGLMLDKSILFNISQVAFGAQRGGLAWYGRRRARARAERQIGNLRIRAQSADTLANQLSGGNQQKVVIGKWLEIGPRVFLLDDPTRGVDVGAKREIYALIRAMSAEGGIVLFSSTELPELVGLCDRILVLYRGRLAGELSGTAIGNRSLLHLINTGEMPPRSLASDAALEAGHA